jgi:hypothetical protein
MARPPLAHILHLDGMSESGSRNGGRHHFLNALQSGTSPLQSPELQT